MLKRINQLILLLVFIFGIISCGAENNEKQEETKIEIQENSTSQDVIRGIEDYSFENNGGEISLGIYFYNTIEEEKLDSYFYVKELSSKNINITSLGKKVVIKGGFKSGKEYNVKIFKGINGIEEDYEFSLKVPSENPDIEFKSEGIYMASSLDKKLRVRSMNLKSGTLEIYKVKSEDVNLYRNRGKIKSGKSDSPNWNKGSSRLIAKEDIQIKGEIDKWVESDIDLSIFQENSNMVNGIYVVKIFTDNDDIHLEEGESNTNERINRKVYRKNIEKTVIISDLGVIVKEYNENNVVYVKNLNTNLPVEGAEVIASLNRYVTDKEGKVVFLKNDWEEILIRKGDDFAFIDSSNYLDYSQADNKGINKNEGITPYIYLTQGVFRPGDEINISAILKEKEKELPDNQNLSMEIYTPQDGLYTILKGVSQGNSLYTFRLKTEESDLTGNWYALLYLGEREDAQSVYSRGGYLGQKVIPIETIVPPTIEIKDSSLIENGEIKIRFNSNYLFGAPGKNLNYKITVDERISSKNFKNYSNYSFTDNSGDGYNNIKILEGRLDENGDGKETLKLSYYAAPYFIDFFIKNEVFQNDGRKVIQNKVLTFSPYNNYVGIESKDGEFFKRGEKISLKTVILTKDGKEIEKELNYTIYENTSRYWWDYGSYEEYKKHYKSSKETIVLEKGRVISGESIEFTPDKNGNYYIEVEAPKPEEGAIALSPHKAGTFIEASYWGWSNGESKADTFVELNFDKKEYNLGDKAKVIFTSPSTGKAIINIEDGKNLIKSVTKSIKEGENNFEFELTNEMFPGVYVNVIMLQELEKKENDKDLRLQGLRYLEIIDKAKVIPITISNEKVYKDAKNVEVKIKGEPDMSYTIAAVDVGVLNLTNFVSPNPYEYFNQQMRYLIGNYDNYKDVLDFQSNPAFNVFKPGGGQYDELELMVANKSKSYVSGKTVEEQINKRPRFEIASQFKTGITDKDGNATIKFNLGNYMGKIKFMVVGVKNNKLGSVEANSEIKEDVVLLPGAPRSLAPEDKFISNLTIHINKPFKKDSIVTLETEGPIDIIGKSQFNFNGSKIGEYNFDFDLKVKKMFGKGILKYTVKSGNKTYSNIINIDVEPKLDTINYTESYIVAPDSSINFTIKKEAFENSSSSKMIVSKFPLSGLYGRLRYLIKYPYGCLEQTTSSIFPQLYIENFMNLTAKEKESIRENINNGINRLEKFQLNNGSMSYWIGENYTSEWGTNYAYFFLLSAKENGYYVSDRMLNMLRNYMELASKSTRDFSLISIQRLYLLSLDNRANINAMNYYYQNEEGLSSLEQLLLAATYDKIGKKEVAQSMFKRVYLGYIGISDDSWSSSFGSAIRDKSLALMAMASLADEKEKTIYEDYILEALSGEKWLSTQSTSYALLAITKNIENESDEETKYYYNIANPLYSSNKVIKYQSSFKGKNETISLDGRSGALLNVHNLSNKNLYINYYFEGVTDPKEQIEFSNEIGLKILYFTEDGEEIPELTSLKKGQSIWAVYGVKKPYNNSYTELVLNQNLASGIEIENLRLQNGKVPKWLEQISKFSIPLRYTDIRDSRVSYFFDFPKYGSYYSGDYGYQYGVIIVKLSAVTKGEFFMPGATLKDMYHDEVGAGTKGFPIKVE